MARDNPYVPLPARIAGAAVETEDREVKTFRVELLDGRFEYACGQFAEILVPGRGEAPFGMASSPLDEGLEFTVRRAGSVTSALHDLEEGDRIGVRGPLGNGFPMGRLEGRDLVLIGGGVGFATLRALARYVLHPRTRARFGRLTVIHGARTPGTLLYRADAAAWRGRADVDLHLSVDREAPGWDGRVGLLPAVTGQVAPRADNAAALVCGPPAMIRSTLPVLRGLGFAPDRVLVSLEMKMKCGVGQCGRCNIGDRYVCRDGPVFSAEELSRMPDEY